MDKLGFVKTVEAVLAAIIAVSIFNFIQNQNMNQASNFNRAPTQELKDALNIISLNEIVKEYDYLELDSLFSRVFFETINYYFEPVYYDRIKIISDNNKSLPTISFTYDFPIGVDKNSIRLITTDYEISTKVLFNWYYLPVSFNNSLIDDYVQINISMDGFNANNNSFKFFVRDYESRASVDYWNALPDTSNVSLIVYVPELEPNEIAYVYFSDNSTNYSVNYPDLTITNYIQPNKYSISLSRTGEVIFQPDYVSTTPTDYYLKYSLFTKEKDSYKDLLSVNNTGLTFDYNNQLKKGSAPLVALAKGGYSVKKIIPTSSGFVELRVYGDYT